MDADIVFTPAQSGLASFGQNYTTPADCSSGASGHRCSCRLRRHRLLYRFFDTSLAVLDKMWYYCKNLWLWSPVNKSQEVGLQRNFEAKDWVKSLNHSQALESCLLDHIIMGAYFYATYSAEWEWEYEELKPHMKWLNRSHRTDSNAFVIIICGTHDSSLIYDRWGVVTWHAPSPTHIPTYQWSPPSPPYI